MGEGRAHQARSPFLGVYTAGRARSVSISRCILKSTSFPSFISRVSLTAWTAVSSPFSWGAVLLEKGVPCGCFETLWDGMWEVLLDCVCVLAADPAVRKVGAGLSPPTTAGEAVISPRGGRHGALVILGDRQWKFRNRLLGTDPV